MEQQCTEGIGDSSSGTSLPTQVYSCNGSSKGGDHLHIVWVFTHYHHCAGTSTCMCYHLYTRCWGHIDDVMVNIKLIKIVWLQPTNSDGNTSSTRDSFNLAHSNIQSSSWYLCHKKTMWCYLTCKTLIKYIIIPTHVTTHVTVMDKPCNELCHVHVQTNYINTTWTSHISFTCHKCFVKEKDWIRGQYVALSPGHSQILSHSQESQVSLESIKNISPLVQSTNSIPLIIDYWKKLRSTKPYCRPSVRPVKVLSQFLFCLVSSALGVHILSLNAQDNIVLLVNHVFQMPTKSHISKEQVSATRLYLLCTYIAVCYSLTKTMCKLTKM